MCCSVASLPVCPLPSVFDERSGAPLAAFSCRQAANRAPFLLLNRRPILPSCSLPLRS